MGDQSTTRRTAALIFLAGCLTGMALLSGGYGIHRMRAGRQAGLVELPAPAAIAGAEGQGAESGEVNQSSLPYAIAGRVVDDHGHPVAEANVRAFDERMNELISTVSDAGGRFRIPGVPLGLYTLEARAVGFAPASRSGVAPGGSDIRLELEPRGDLVGRVIRDAQGVEGITVLIGGPGLFPPRAVTTGAEGRFQVRDVSSHSLLELVALGDAAGSGFGTFARLDEQSQVVIELDDAPVLVMEVTDAETGRPVEAGVLSVSRDALHVLSVSEPLEGGRVVVRGVPVGTYYVRVRAPGYLPLERPLTLAGEGSQRLTLDRGSSVSGRVIDVQGSPLASVSIELDVRDELGRRWRLAPDPNTDVDRLIRADGQPLWPPPYHVETGSDGTFLVTGLPRGRVVLTATKPGYALTRSDPIETDGQSAHNDLEIRLHTDPGGGE